MISLLVKECIEAYCRFMLGGCDDLTELRKYARLTVTETHTIDDQKEPHVEVRLYLTYQCTAPTVHYGSSKEGAIRNAIRFYESA
jgi:hypothetical protein